jgi:hypothetical protein
VVHDDHVTQQVTNGHIAITGYHCMEKIFHGTKNGDKTDLGEEFFVHDALILCLYVHQHFWDFGCA